MDLVPFASADASALRWLRVVESPLAFELASDDRPVARLAADPRSGTLATLTTTDRRWTINRVGFLHARVAVRAAAGAEELGQVTLHLDYHRIALTRGAIYRLHRADPRTGVRVPAWKLTTDAGEEVLHIEPVREGRKLEGGAVLTGERFTQLPELALLIGLAWYVIVHTWFEDEALVPFEGPEAPGSGSATSG